MLALPIFPASHPASIVGEGVLNFCVRDGNRWTHTPINTNFVGTDFVSLASALRPKLAHAVVPPLKIKTRFDFVLGTRYTLKTEHRNFILLIMKADH